ncbi:MAG TPA: hypothetical protein VFQ54_02450, partial [Thermomicrobiales bacterium]|nr:hypothetical protein [Thermomicrobiales bacterium]
MVEPNDQPPQATDLGTDAGCATSPNAHGGQDVFKWTVDDAGAAKRWTISTSAIPGQAVKLEIYTVTIDANGVVTNPVKLTGVSGDSGQAASIDNVLVAKGTYFVATAIGGGGAYELTVSPGDPVPAANDTGDHASPETALPLQDAFALSGDRASAVDDFAWTLDDRAAATHWTLMLQGPIGTSPGLSIFGSDGTTLFSDNAGADGKLVIPDLGLAAGTYVLSVGSSSDAAAPYILSAVAGDLRSPQAEDEPNDGIASGMPIALNGNSTTIHGRLATLDGNGSNTDYYTLTGDDSTAGRYLDVRVVWQSGPSRKLCLEDPAGNALQCAEGDTGAALHDLVLGKGAYTISISGDTDPAAEYLLKVDLKQKAVAGFETEPNDAQAQASAMVTAPGGSFQGSGRFSAGDDDFFKFTVSGDAQLWEVEIMGTGVSHLGVVDASGTSGSSRNVAAGTTDPTRIDDLYLTPGDHWLDIEGANGDYAVTVKPLGPPDPEGEREPNDNLDFSQAINLQETRNGRITDAGDTDVYRFSLQNDTYVTIGLDSPADAVLGMSIREAAMTYTSLSAANPGDALHYDAYLQAGDYSIWITASTPSEANYHLRIAINDPFDLPADLEPNDSIDEAQPLPASMIATGTVDSLASGGDIDWYILPASLEGQQVTVEYTPGTTITLWTAQTKDTSQSSVPLISGTVDGSYLAALPAEVLTYLEVSGTGSYQVAIVPDGATPPAIASLVAATPGIATPPASPVAVNGVTASLKLDTTPVAAFWSNGQRLGGALTLTNDSAESRDLALTARTGNALWTVDLDQTKVTVKPGATISIPVAVHIAPDAWSGQPIYVAIAASFTGTTDAASTFVLVVPNADAPPVNSEQYDPLPASLLGGLDVAWTGLGATPMPADGQDPTEVAQLFDQLTTTGTGLSVDVSSLPQDYTVELAGTDPVPVAGFTLDPRGAG